MKTLHNLLFFLLLIPSTVLPSIYPKRHLHNVKSIKLEQLETYYLKKTNGLIYHPAEADIENSGKIILNTSKRWDRQLDLVDQGNYDFVQNYFAFDILGFISTKNRLDFNSAKIAYYQSLNLDPETQLHERPYFYLEPWGLLNHPPIKQLTLPLEIFDHRFDSKNINLANSQYFDPNFHYNLDKVSNTVLTAGNEVKLLANNSAYLEKIRFIREAKSYIFISIMTIWCDQSSEVLTDELIKKAQEGIDVKIITETFYGKFASRGCISKLKKNGVEVLYVSDLLKAGGMMHSKFWIRDGIEAILGGENIIRQDNIGTGFNGNNRDSDLLLKGPSVTDLMDRFIAMWNKYKKKKNSVMDSYQNIVSEKMKMEIAKGNRGQNFYQEWLADPNKRMTGLCRVAVQGAKADPISIAKIQIELMKAAKQHVVFSSPTVMFNLKNKVKFDNDLFISILKAKAAKENVMVDILSNGYGGSEGEVTIMLNDLKNKFKMKGKNFWARAVERYIINSSILNVTLFRKQLFNLTAVSPNIRSWEYFQYIHAKQYLYDHIVGSVGSWNLDMRSANKGHETQIFCQDSKLVSELENQFVLDMANSIPTVSANNK